MDVTDYLPADALTCIGIQRLGFHEINVFAENDCPSPTIIDLRTRPATSRVSFHFVALAVRMSGQRPDAVSSEGFAPLNQFVSRPLVRVTRFKQVGLRARILR